MSNKGFDEYGNYGENNPPLDDRFRRSEGLDDLSYWKFHAHMLEGERDNVRHILTFVLVVVGTCTGIGLAAIVQFLLW